MDLVEIADSARTKTRWLEAVVRFARGDFRPAAERFGRIGSLPDAALAHLLAAEALYTTGREAEGRAELLRAVAFYRRVDAGTYLSHAEALAGTAFVTGGPQA